jgi:predicted transcriptional regulator of viral defense system
MTKITNVEGVLPEIFKPTEVARLSENKITTRNISYALRKLLKEKKVVKLKRNLYAKTTANPYEIACFAFKGYVGFSSALYLHGLKEESEKEIQVCVKTSSKPLKFLNRTITPVNIGAFLYGTQFIDRVLVSTYAKTIFDCFLKPKNAGFFDLFRALNRRKPTESEWRELFQYLKDSNITTIRRAGYALEGKSPGWFINNLEKLNRKGVSCFMKEYKGEFNSKWGVYDDIQIKRWEDAI